MGEGSETMNVFKQNLGINIRAGENDVMMVLVLWQVVIVSFQEAVGQGHCFAPENGSETLW